MISTQRRRNLALDLWELAAYYGTGVVSPQSWCLRYGKKGTALASTMRRWERLLARIRESQFPVTFVPCVGPVARIYTRDDGQETTASEVKALGIALWPGAREQLTALLNTAAGIA